MHNLHDLLFEESTFEENLNLQHLLVYRLHVIGEAARNVSKEFQQSHPEIPWQEVKALRNRLIHGYFNINVNIVFQIAQLELPNLIITLKKTVPAEYQNR